MANRISSRLETILPAIKAQVASLTSLDTSLVFVTLRNDVELTQRSPTDAFIAIRPGQFPIWEEAVMGGGTDVTWIDGALWITYYKRYAVDADWADDSWLLDPTNGMLGLWSTLLHGLQLFDPTDMSGNLLLAEPMRLAATGWHFPNKRPIAGWGALRSLWECKFIHSI